jgi:cytochrome c556
METVKAAKAKNQDAIVDVADKMTSACSACHDVYREKPDVSARCTK